jgi:hypothetical protein
MGISSIAARFLPRLGDAGRSGRAILVIELGRVALNRVNPRNPIDSRFRIP